MSKEIATKTEHPKKEPYEIPLYVKEELTYDLCEEFLSGLAVIFPEVLFSDYAENVVENFLSTTGWELAMYNACKKKKKNRVTTYIKTLDRWEDADDFDAAFFELLKTYGLIKNQTGDNPI